ncbi:MAG: DUF5671 domain-containing protein [Patescibacteria group bacterium]
MENTPQVEKVSPKHVFLHLFVIVLLYYTTINFLVLIFQCINHWFPDALTQINYYQAAASSEMIRFALASLIIVFPVFMIASKLLRKSYITSPAIRDMRTRKWLLYFTLFVAALVMIGDMVGVILTYLNGEITTRFVFKAAAVLVSAGAIFFYYLRDLKQEIMTRSTKIFIWCVIVVVAGAVVAGFFAAGSPKTARMIRFDADRISDLASAQSQIVNYWQTKEHLPNTFADLNDDIKGYSVPADPETSAAYEYYLTGTTSFKLCATFDLVSDDEVKQSSAVYYYGSDMDNWKHDVGYYCFERTIDTEFYPFISEKK